MTHEPHDCHSVSIRAVMPKDGKTLEQYQAEVAARFGGKLPSWTDLAKRENAARLRREHTSSMARVQKPIPVTEKTVAGIAAIVAKGEKTRGDIICALTKPMTCPDIAYALRRTRQLVQRHLQILSQRGEVVGTKVKGTVIWERRQEAAE